MACGASPPCPPDPPAAGPAGAADTAVADQPGCTTGTAPVPGPPSPPLPNNNPPAPPACPGAVPLAPSPISGRPNSACVGALMAQHFLVQICHGEALVASAPHRAFRHHSRLHELGLKRRDLVLEA